MKKQYSKELLSDMWTKMNLAREFENRVQWLFSMGLVHGTTHLGVGAPLKSNGIKTVMGEASLSSETTVNCGGMEYHADSIILCGGSKANRILVQGMDHKNVLTSDEILNLEEMPKRLAVIGGGLIGCEMAVVFSAYGCEVTIIEAEENILPSMDEEIVKGLEASLKRKHVKILTGQMVDRVLHTEKESLVCCKSGKEITVDKILLSIGRTADLSCLGSLKDRIKTERGRISADDQMRTNILNIFAPGDINGRSMLAHAAFKMGETAARNALGEQVSCNLKLVPGCVYTIPEASGVGMTEKEAVQEYGRERISTGKFPFAANGRALASGDGTGFVKVITENRYHEILGVHILGGPAAEMIAEAAALMASEIPSDEAADIIHAHPSYAEAFMEACADSVGRCMHLPKKQRIMEQITLENPIL